MAAPIDTGDTVVTAAAMLAAPSAAALVHQSQPQRGVVESATAGPPPTAVTVAWADGTRTLYPVIGSGPTSVLLRLGTAPSGVALLNRVVQPTAASGIPNPSGRLRGPVSQQFGLEDPSGNFVAEVVVVETPIGALVTAFANVEVVLSA
jgi:hypothetical protein